MAVLGPHSDEDITSVINQVSMINFEDSESSTISLSQQIFKTKMGEMRNVLSQSNTIYANLNESNLYILLYCAELLRKLRSHKSETSTLMFISRIGFILNGLENYEADNLHPHVEELIGYAKDYDFLSSSTYDLMPWLTSERNVIASIHFLGANLPTYFNRLLRKTIIEADYIEISFLKDIDRQSLYYKYLQDTFLPALFLSIEAPEINKIEVFFKLIPLFLEVIIPIQGSAKRYVGALNQLLVDNLQNLDADKIFSVLHLNNEIINRGGSIDLKSKESLITHILTLNLNEQQIKFLWELRWTIFNDLKDAQQQVLAGYFERQSEILEKASFSWATMAADTIESAVMSESSSRPSRRVLPYFNIQKEQAVLREATDIKVRQVIPGNANQLKFGAVIFCARILHEMGALSASRDSMLNLALVTQVLKASNNIDSDEALEFALQMLKGAFKVWGIFQKYAMPEYLYMTPSNILSTGLLDKNVARRLGFLKSTNLQRYSRSVVLPRLLDSSDVRLSLKEIERCSGWSFVTPISLHSHLADDFLPKLFLSLQKPLFEDLNELVGTLTKIALEFPIDLCAPPLLNFARNIGEYIAQHLNVLSEAELCNLLKLCELMEIKYGKNLLTLDQQEAILDVLLKDKKSWETNGNLIRFKWTIFNDIPRERFAAVSIQTEKYFKNRNQEAVRVTSKHPHELKLANILRDHLPDYERNCIYHSYVCPDTGREIDVAYVQGNIRLAIHIDGVQFHYFNDRFEKNFDTITSRQALSNAGWVNAHVNLPPEKILIAAAKLEIYANNAAKLIYQLNNGEFKNAQESFDLTPNLFFDPTYFVDIKSKHEPFLLFKFGKSILDGREKEIIREQKKLEIELKHEQEKLQKQIKKQELAREQERLKAEKNIEKHRRAKKQ